MHGTDENQEAYLFYFQHKSGVNLLKELKHRTALIYTLFHCDEYVSKFA